MMKRALFVSCLLTATAAMGQSVYSGANLAPNFQVADHRERAASQPMGQEQNLLGGGSVTIGHGEMPLSEVPLEEKYVMPLGDVARLVRKQHTAMRKAQVVWEKVK